jgi:hypothetical protein
MLKSKQQGQDRPLIYPVSSEVRDAVYSYVAEHPGLDIITMARSSVEPERGIAIMLESDHEIGTDDVAEVQSLVQQARGEAVPVVVHILQSAKVRSPRPIDESGEVSGGAEP